MTHNSKRFLSILLSLVLMLSLVPVTVFAQESTEGDPVARNTATNQQYTSLSEATEAAQAGQTVQLLQNTSASVVCILEDTTLDLNGCTLQASYVSSYGSIVDSSRDNTGLLNVATNRLMMRSSNAQIPVLTDGGYQFVQLVGFNALLLNDSKYVFQPLFEPYAHALLAKGQASTGVSVNVRISWDQGDGQRSQLFVYNDDFVSTYLASYNESTGRYGLMFTLTLAGNTAVSDLKFEAVVLSGPGVEIGDRSFAEAGTQDGSSTDVTTDENSKLTEDVTVTSGTASAVVAQGTQLELGVTQVTLTATPLESSGSDVVLESGEEMLSMDVHLEGVAADNTVPVLVTLDQIAPEFLNQGNITLYHVENGVTVPMTRVYSLAEVDAHNEYYYDIITGTVTMALASFSEIALVSDTENAWEGNYDYSWYDADKTELTIANADQLAAFGAIVGGMNGQTQDSFSGKTVKLIADINLGYGVENHTYSMFHPIGYYYTDDKNEDDTTGDYYSTVSSFEGTFDGTGHTIANFYQNTWAIKGDYSGNYYSDAMGLFGYVVNGKVCNLTVENFSSDGEFTPTGVIAAYAVNSTFENISLTNCNPRVYNTGNGGIVGIGGNSDDPDTYKLTFTNITIDNSNKISALWGSWDVACGGLVGMFRGAGHAYMTNCHVAAQIDVYNDVCGNYQYYWYRYSGMMIGTNRNMITDTNGYTVPETSKFHAENCTVHFGDWNDYYYCELVANSLASYTHDHQFSRLTEISSLDEIKSGDTWTKTGNYLLISGDTKTCYHIVNKDGVLTRHLHTDAGEETVNGETVLKEDKQIVYLPFNQLFTGYGWGVKHIPVYNGEDYAFEGITILDREVADSVEKFEKADTAKDFYTTETTVTIGELFKAAATEDEKLTIKPENVQVFVSPVSTEAATSTANGTYTANTTDWTKGTLTFTGLGAATVTITDYYFCTPTTINITVEDQQPEVKFDVVMNNGDFLHRVGNSGTVALDKLFAEKTDVEIGAVSVTVEAVDGTGASGTYDSNADTIQFNDTGVVKVTITDNDYCTPTELYLEVVDATNVISLSGTISGNVVLLNNCSISSLTVSGRNAVYGNGFTATYTGNGQYLNNGLKQGVVTVSENGTLDNLRIVAPIYPKAFLYYGTNSLGEAVQDQNPVASTDGKTRYEYQLSAVAASGNATISNCYIYGGRNNIFMNTGNVTVKDSILECGVVANVQIQSNSDYTITFEDVTTIQHQVNPTIDDTSLVMLGAGVLVGPETTENPAIVLNGEFKQYNWVTSDDANAVSDTKITKAIIQGALDATAYNHTVNNKTASNLGIIYMNTYDDTENITDKTGLPYVYSDVSIKVSGNTISGKVYSLQNATAGQIYSDYANADRTTENDLYQPQFKYSTDLGGQYIAEGGDEHCYREGDTVYVMFPAGDTKELDLAALVDIQKYTGQNLNLVVTCKDSNGDAVTVTDGKITLSAIEEYTITYTVKDGLFYDKDGNQLNNAESIEYSWDVTIIVSLKDTAVPNAYFEFDSTKQVIYADPTNWLGNGDYKQSIPFLAGLKIYDYNGQTSYLRFDGDNDFAKIAKASINNVNTTGEAAGYHIVTIELVDGGKLVIDMDVRATSGGSTHTGSIKVASNVLYVVNGGTTSAKGQQWRIYDYEFTGNNGETINSGAITFGTSGTDAETNTAASSNFSTTINYTVTYDANGGNCGQTVGYATSANNNTVTLPTPTLSGYVFAGWYTAATGGDREGGAGDSYTPSANITLYAQWKEPITVTFDANGGACNTTTAVYTTTAITLPQATNGNKVLKGWFTAATDGTKIGGAGESYTPTTNITLYAQWQDPATVTYDANGGTCSIASDTYTGTPLTLPTPDARDYYKFLGWSDGTTIYAAGASFSPTADITLYAQWQGYTVTYNANNGSVSPSSATYAGTPLILPTPTRTLYTFNGWYTAASGGDRKGGAGDSYTPTTDITLYAQWTSSISCVTPDTLVTMADGTQKRIDEVTYEDQLLVWNFYTGENESVTSSALINHGYGEYEVLELHFSDGAILKIIGAHGVFHKESKQFVDLAVENVDSYLGEVFLKNKGDRFEEVTLTGYMVYTEYTESWTIVTKKHYTAYCNDLFTASPSGSAWDTEKQYPLLEPYEAFALNDDLKFDEEQMRKDIETYGLYTYEDFDGLLTYEQFIDWDIAPMKVIVGKGYATKESVCNYIALLQQFHPADVE